MFDGGTGGVACVGRLVSCSLEEIMLKAVVRCYSGLGVKIEHLLDEIFKL